MAARKRGSLQGSAKARAGLRARRCKHWSRVNAHIRSGAAITGALKTTLSVYFQFSYLLPRRNNKLQRYLNVGKLSNNLKLITLYNFIYLYNTNY